MANQQPNTEKEITGLDIILLDPNTLERHDKELKELKRQYKFNYNEKRKKLVQPLVEKILKKVSDVDSKLAEFLKLPISKEDGCLNLIECIISAEITAHLTQADLFASGVRIITDEKDHIRIISWCKKIEEVIPFLSMSYCIPYEEGHALNVKIWLNQKIEE